MSFKRSFFIIPRLLLMIIVVSLHFIDIAFGPGINNGVEKVMKEVHEIEYRTLNYGDRKMLSKLVKDKMKDRVSVVSELKEVMSDESIIIYKLEHYEISLKLENQSKLEKVSIPMIIEDIDTNFIAYEKIEVDIVDEEEPKIVLSNNEIVIYDKDEFIPLQYVVGVSDNYDTILNCVSDSNTMIKNNNLWMIGEYQIVYSCIDQSNNKGTATLKVNVIESEKEVMNKMDYNNSLVSNAYALLGKPYLWGATGPDSFDCSGLIMYLYSLEGNILEWKNIQYGVGKQIGLNSVQWLIGDILSYQDNTGEIIHHAMYMGNHKAIHALADGVQIIDIDTPLLAINGGYQILARVFRI